jgi:hypothetical protein
MEVPQGVKIRKNSKDKKCLPHRVSDEGGVREGIGDLGMQLVIAHSDKAARLLNYSCSCAKSVTSPHK